MHLPDVYRFPETALLLVTDRLHAKIFRLHGDELETITDLHADGYPLDDTEKYSIQVYGTVHAGGEDEHIRERVATSFFDDVGRRLHDMYLRGEFAQLFIVVPEDQKNVLLQSLSVDVAKTVQHVVPLNLTHEHPLKILERIFERE